MAMMMSLRGNAIRGSCLQRLGSAFRFSTAATSHAAADSSGSTGGADGIPRGVIVAVLAAACTVSGMGIWILPRCSPASSSQASSVSYEDSVLVEQKRKPWFLLTDSYRRKVFFNYEKRIRLRSSPEKIFEYFASMQTSDGETFMLPADLMRAVVPVFPPSQSPAVRGGQLRGEHCMGDLHCAPSEFFMLFDTNNDGLISFSEYIFLVTLLSIPESSFTVAFKMFDIDNDGEIDREEFKKVMTLMRSRNRQGSSHRDGLRPGLKVNRSVENGGILEYFFGEDGSGRLPYDKFVEFLRDLRDEIVRLEFAHYDFKSSGTISAKDFALSMVASADINHIDRLLDRVDNLDKTLPLNEKRFTFEEFAAFAELRRSLEPLAVAIFSYGESGNLTKQDFKHAALNVCGISITDNMVDIVFHVFDGNCDGNISYEEFVRALQR